MARLSGRPVLLENLAHQVLACESAGRDTGTLLAGWESRSRAVAPAERTAYDAASGWLVTTVGARGQDWGRLILLCDAKPSPRDLVLAERAATTLALGRLLERHQESLERQAHGTIITGILTHAYADPDEAAARARAVGVPLTGRKLVSVVIRPTDPVDQALDGQAAARRAGRGDRRRLPRRPAARPGGRARPGPGRRPAAAAAPRRPPSRR